MAKVFNTYPNFDNFNIKDQRTKDIMETWNDQQNGGGPLFTRPLNFGNQKNIKVPTI